MPSRYNKARILTNNSDYYEPIRKSRGSKSIVHQATRPMVNPTVAQRASIRTTYHTWKYGDRLMFSLIIIMEIPDTGGLLRGGMDITWNLK